MFYARTRGPIALPNILLCFLLLTLPFQTLSLSNFEDGPDSTSDISVHSDPQTSLPLIVAPREGLSFIPLQSSSPSLVDRAYTFLNTYTEVYGIENPHEELVVYRTTESKDGTSMRHIKMSQRKNGIPVFGAELIVHFNEKAEVTSVNGTFIPHILASSIPTLSADEAKNRAVAEEERVRKEENTVERPAESPSTSSLVYFNKGLLAGAPTDTVLAWKVTVYPNVYLLHAHTGEILLSYPLEQSALNREVYTSGETWTLPGFQLMNEAGFLYNPFLIPDRAESDAQEAYNYTKQTYDYYFTTHRRDSYDGNGASIISSVNFFYPGRCPNAYWRSDPEHPEKEQMIYCTDMTMANDAVAHELTHAVTEYSVGENNEGLIYIGQSGALNESYSDVFAAMVDRTDWLIGEDLNGPPIRDMEDPRRSRSSQPDHMGHPLYVEYIPPCDGKNDNCGVHQNSGIPNKAAYLLSEPGRHTHYGIPVDGIGREKVYLFFGGVESDPYVDLRLIGESEHDSFGRSVSSVGDVNRDGRGDILVSATDHPYPGYGTVYIFTLFNDGK